MASAFNIISSDAFVDNETDVMPSQCNALVPVELGEQQFASSVMSIEFLMESKGYLEGYGGELAIWGSVLPV